MTAWEFVSLAIGTGIASHIAIDYVSSALGPLFVGIRQIFR